MSIELLGLLNTLATGLTIEEGIRSLTGTALTKRLEEEFKHLPEVIDYEKVPIDMVYYVGKTDEYIARYHFETFKEIFTAEDRRRFKDKFYETHRDCEKHRETCDIYLDTFLSKLESKLREGMTFSQIFLLNKMEEIGKNVAAILKSTASIEEIKYDLERLADIVRDNQEAVKLLPDIYAIVKKHYDVIKDGGGEQQSCSAPSSTTKKNETDVSQAISIRKLSDELWVNWKTGWLTVDYETAIASFDKAWEAAQGIGDGENSVHLSPEELRLLSALVQGEGASVRWEELYARWKVGYDDNIYILNHKDNEDVFAGRTRNTAAGLPDEDKDKQDIEIVIVKKSFDKLRKKDPRLASILSKDENGKGCRIVVPYDAGEIFPGSSADKDLEKLKEPDKDGCAKGEDVQVWLRRYYSQACDYFENNASNTPDSGGAVFGNYSMADIYMNAYASEDYRDESGSRFVEETETDGEKQGYGDSLSEAMNTMETVTDNPEVKEEAEEETKEEAEEKKNAEVMLDYIEKWFCITESDETGLKRTYQKKGDGLNEPKISYGRILVLHGRPGDGKTTFCRKAVYAHAKEGWLHAAPQVLYFSLNPSESKITSGSTFDLSKALCFKEELDLYFCDKGAKEFKKSLIILDGYDELCEKLRKVDGDYNFEKFCEAVRNYANTCRLNVIVTSRTMCIRDEIESLKEKDYISIASFAPMTTNQQDAMIDRMIELDKTGEELERYRKSVLPKLRKKENLKALFRIPSLFRMIVTVRFDDSNNAQTLADLYGDLFYKLMKHRGISDEDVKIYVRYYEQIASRIFYYDRSTCPFGKAEKEENEKKRMLCYIFLTDNSKDDAGHLGFLHKSFYQYFLARFIASEIKTIGQMGLDGRTEDVEKEFNKFLAILSTERLSEVFLWTLVKDVIKPLPVELRSGAKPMLADRRCGVSRGEHGKKPGITIHSAIQKIPVCVDHIRFVMECLNQKQFVDGKKRQSVVGRIADGRIGDTVEMKSDTGDVITDTERINIRVYQRAPEADKGYILETKNAIYNLISACAAAENGCFSDYSKAGQEAAELKNRIAYGEKDKSKKGYSGKGKKEKSIFDNVFRMLRSGHYAGIYLEGMNLSGCDLRNSRLEGAFMSGTHLEGTQLDGSRLDGAHMDGTYLTGASLQAASLKAAYLRGAVMEDADLAWADLRGARMLGAVLQGARLKRAVFQGARLQKAVLTGLRDAEYVNLDEAHMEEAYLEGSTITKSQMTSAKFTGAHLEKARLTSSHLERAELTGAHMNGTVLQWSYLDGAYCRNADMREAFIDDASLCAAYLEGAKLEGASLIGTNLDRAVMTESQLTEIGFTKDDNCESESVFFGRPDTIEEMIRRTQRQVKEGKKRVIFGRYRQGANGEIEPLLWRVLHVDNNRGRALLITEKLIDCRRYHDVLEDITWEDCSLREWMNGEFIETVFAKEEASKIVKVRYSNLDYTSGWNGQTIDDGNATEDKIFALSVNDVSENRGREGSSRTYFRDNDDRMAVVTPYAKAKGSGVWQNTITNGEKTGRWWLRSPGIFNDFAADVGSDGDVHGLGSRIDVSGASVRPAFWLNL